MNKKEISYRLCTARVQSGKTYRQISDETGLSLNALANTMTKGGMPRADTLAKLCVCLGCSADWILGLEGKPHDEL